LLFDRPEYQWDFFSRSFDVSLDGRRLLMVSTEGSDVDEMVLVLNLTSELHAIPDAAHTVTSPQSRSGQIAIQ
jgi:hypothetical protein